MLHADPRPAHPRAGFRFCAVLLAGAALAAPALAQTLTIGLANPVNTIDPHFTNTTANFALSGHVFEALIARDARNRFVPGLAESWTPVGETAWEFRLRSGVAWHDGQPFTADDVAFTIERVPNVQGSAGGYTGAVRTIIRVEVVDAHTIRFHSAQPNPLLPNELATVQIISRHAGTDANPPDYNSGRAMIGTGPYRFVNYRPGDGAAFVRNDAYWRGAEPWARVNYRFIANDGARTAAVLAGDVDVIEQVPGNDLPRLRRDPRVSIAEASGIRLIYLQADFSRQGGDVPGVTDNNGQRLARNPFLDRRVRRALSIAIDRHALAERIMSGTAVPTGQWLPEGSYSHNPAVGVPAFSPDQARRLLSEAGFPQGFRMVLTTPNDRYPGDAATAQAVAQFWTRIGVRTEVQSLPWSNYQTRGRQREFGFRLGGWGSSSGEASYLLRNVIGTPDRARGWGTPNYGQYSNPALDALTRRAITTMDDEMREALLREAVQVAAEDLGMVPLFLLKNAWAVRRGFRYEARADEQTLAASTRPAP